MTRRTILGALMLAALPLAVWTKNVMDFGWMETLKAMGIGLLVVAWVLGGAYLIVNPWSTEDENEEEPKP